MLNFSSVRKIHFLGVGGVSMSSLIRFFRAKGYDVSGSDRAFSPTLVDLNEEGVNVWVGFEPVRMGKPDLAVFTSALSPSDAELTYLRSCGVPTLERHAFLPYLSSFFPRVVAVAGTHGKTTVTSMCAVVLQEAGASFYAHIGGKSRDLPVFPYSGDDLLLIEACEFRRSMLSLSPSVAVVLNAEVDHPDTYRDKSDVFDAFDDFLSSCSDQRIVFGDGDYYSLRQSFFSPTTFGFLPSDRFRAVDVKQYDNACFGFRILRDGEPLCEEIRLRVPGKTNVLNAVACAAICSSLSIRPEVVKRGLTKFSGVERRFEYRGKTGNAAVYVDYAHHPTEIASSIETARLIAKKRLTVVFQPHTFSRTARLKKEFLDVLRRCERLIVVKEYAARENPSDGCSALALFRECSNEEKYYADTLLDAAALVLQKCREDEMVLILGAGDVEKITEFLG